MVCTAVTFREMSSAAVEGFIIQGGGTYGGDGVHVDNCLSVIIAHNRIQDCIGGASHGIRWSQSGGSISGNTISNNGVGSGIYINQVREGCGTPTGICQVVVMGNRIIDNRMAYNGGGILVVNMWSDEQGSRSRASSPATRSRAMRLEMAAESALQTVPASESGETPSGRMYSTVMGAASHWSIRSAASSRKT